jgi:hypothetical protein
MIQIYIKLMGFFSSNSTTIVMHNWNTFQVLFRFQGLHGNVCLVFQSFSAKSISSSVQYVALHKYFLHPSLVTYFFPPSPINLKLRLQIGGSLLTTNHLDVSETRSSSWIIFIPKSLPGVRLCYAKMLDQNHFAKPNQHVLTFLHPILIGKITYWALVKLL